MKILNDLLVFRIEDNDKSHAPDNKARETAMFSENRLGA